MDTLLTLVPTFSLDVLTMVWLLFLGNLLAGSILSLQSERSPQDRGFRRFALGKFLQGVAWGCFVLRGNIPDAVSILVGNGLLLVGSLLEAYAIIEFSSKPPRLKSLTVGLAVLGAGAFLLLGSTPGRRIEIASLLGFAIFGGAALSLLASGQRSRLRIGMGLSYAVFSIALLARALYSATHQGEMELFTINIVQSISLLLYFLTMALGSAGFLSLNKERTELALLDAHRELTLREAMLDNIFNTSSVAIFLLDNDGRISMANRGMGEMFRCAVESIVGRQYVDFLPPGDRENARAGMRSLLANRIATHKVERRYRRSDGSEFWGQLTGARMHNVHKDEHQLLGVISDITDLKLAEERILAMAQHDPLTGLANRALFSDRVQQALGVAQRDRTQLALLYLDLDGFKPVNDSYGHAVGDALLVEVAQRIVGNVRESDTVGRIGGDEFVVLLRHIENGDSALGVAEKIRQSIDVPFYVDTQFLSISCCIGVALYPEHARTEPDLSKSADRSMYQAKGAGGNRVYMEALDPLPAAGP